MKNEISLRLATLKDAIIIDNWLLEKGIAERLGIVDGSKGVLNFLPLHSESQKEVHMFMYRDSAIGFVCIDWFFLNEHKAIDIERFLIQPESRRAGYGKQALKLLLDYMSSRWRTGVRFRAMINSGNSGSLKLFKSFGFNLDPPRLSSDSTAHILRRSKYLLSKL